MTKVYTQVIELCIALCLLFEGILHAFNTVRPCACGSVCLKEFEEFKRNHNSWSVRDNPNETPNSLPTIHNSFCLWRAPEFISRHGLKSPNRNNDLGVVLQYSHQQRSHEHSKGSVGPFRVCVRSVVLMMSCLSLLRCLMPSRIWPEMAMTPNLKRWSERHP